MSDSYETLRAQKDEINAKENQQIVYEGLVELTKLAHTNSRNGGWWHSEITGEELLSNPVYAPFVIATKLMLGVSEVAEGLEGFRTDKMDDKLPHRSMLEVELADVILRVLDLAGRLELDVAGAVIEKANFNTTRPDHDVVNRRKPGGKKF